MKRWLHVAAVCWLAMSDQVGAGDQQYRVTEHQIEAVGAKLEGRLYEPVNRPAGYPLVITVAGSGNDETTNDPYTKLLVDTWARGGIGVLAFNKRGVGLSTGVYTELDFDERARDVVAVYDFAKTLPNADKSMIGAWGISQAGWVLPKFSALRPDAKFLVMVSPAGVDPARQVEFYLRGEFAKLGLSLAEAASAVEVFHSIFLYYRTGDGYARAQASVDRARRFPWYGKIEQHPFWHNMAGPGLVYTPAELQAAIRAKPGDFAWTLAPSTLADYRAEYRSVRVPVLVIYGGKDELIPTNESLEIFGTSFRQGGNRDVTFRTFPDADHSIQISPSAVAPGYRETVRDWILSRRR